MRTRDTIHLEHDSRTKAGDAAALAATLLAIATLISLIYLFGENNLCAEPDQPGMQRAECAQQLFARENRNVQN